MLTAERLREVLDYDPETGAFRWRTLPPNRAPRVQAAGSVTTGPGGGYISIRVDRRAYPAHRLAFLWMTGNWPSKQVDHRDLNRANNAWGNLREATRSQNHANTRVRVDSASGIKGVQPTAAGTFKAKIKKDGQVTCLGTFKTKEEAGAAYQAAARDQFGEFAQL